jgi:hypothetical protein
VSRRLSKLVEKFLHTQQSRAALVFECVRVSFNSRRNEIAKKASYPLKRSSCAASNPAVKRYQKSPEECIWNELTIESMLEGSEDPLTAKILRVESVHSRETERVRGRKLRQFNKDRRSIQQLKRERIPGKSFTILCWVFALFNGASRCADGDVSRPFLAVAVEMRVVRVHVHQSLVVTGKPSRVDPEKWRPLITSFRQYFGLGSALHPSKFSEFPEETFAPNRLQPRARISGCL